MGADRGRPPTRSRPTDRLRPIAVAAVLAVGLGLRAWFVWGRLGVPDSDEAVSGLVAHQMLHGHFPLFFWGQSYGGTLEEGLIAAWFRLVGPSSPALKLVPALLGAAGVGLTWRIGRRTIGPPAAAVAAAITSVWPLGNVYWSTKARGFYGTSLVLGLAIVLLALRLRDHADAATHGRAATRDWIALGLAIGLAWWSTPLSALILVPVGIWLVAQRRPSLRQAVAGLAATLVAVLPWTIWNLHHHWASLTSPHQPGASNSYVDHLQRFAVRGLPLALGLEVPLRPGWLVGPVIGWSITIIVFAAAIVVAARTTGPTRLLVAVLLAYPLLLALTPDAFYLEDTRYLYLFHPFVALLVAHGLYRFRVELVGLAVAVGLTFAGLRSFTPDHQVRLAPLAHALEAHHIDRVGAPYWIAYNLSFQSNGRVVATPTTGTVRSAAYVRTVRAAARVGFVVTDHPPSERRFEQSIGHRTVLERFHSDGYVVYVLRGRDARSLIPSAVKVGATP